MGGVKPLVLQDVAGQQVHDLHVGDPLPATVALTEASEHLQSTVVPANPRINPRRRRGTEHQGAAGAVGGRRDVAQLVERASLPLPEDFLRLRPGHARPQFAGVVGSHLHVDH
jgi:hypothetical protein